MKRKHQNREISVILCSSVWLLALYYQQKQGQWNFCVVTNAVIMPGMSKRGDKMIFIKFLVVFWEVFPIAFEIFENVLL